MDHTRTAQQMDRRPSANPNHGNVTLARQRLLFGLLFWLRVEFPLCGKHHGLALYGDDLEKLADAADEATLDARLNLLSRDRPLVRCPVCVVRLGGEAHPQP